MLPATRSGRGPRLALLHGFTQEAGSWGPLRGGLDRDHEVVAVDLPGHGRAGHLDLDLGSTAAAVADTVGLATYVGYSMGGRVALRLALDRPGLVERLVLIGATPGIDDPGERAARRERDEELAASIERDGVEAFLERWLSQPLFATLAPSRAGRAARLANTPTGLAASLRSCGTGTMDPPWWDELDRLGAAGIPVTLVAGDLDTRFAALARRMADAIGPTAEVVLVPDTGHACHLEDPAAVVEVVAGHARPAS